MSQVFTNMMKNYKSMAVVGLGQQGGAGFNRLKGIDVDTENARFAATVGVRKLESKNCDIIRGVNQEQPVAVGEGSGLDAWRYQNNRALEN